MPLYYFHLNDGADLLKDDCGTWLDDLSAASEHAASVACELMLHCERESRHRKIEIHADGRLLLVVLFATVDPTLDHLGRQDRKVIERSRALIGDLKRTVVQCAMTHQYSQALCARMARKPYIAADRGRRVL